MERIGVIGCGTMGHSIALNIAWANMQVKMYGTDRKDIESAKSGIYNKLHVLFDNHLIDRAQIEEISNRIYTTTSMSELVDKCTFIIEAVPEDINLKKDLFQQLDRICDEEVILASNFREAQYLLEKGIATKEDIDVAVVYSIGRRLPVTGPLLSADMGGLDVFDKISDYLSGELCDAKKSQPVLKDLVGHGKLGCKSGQGFYEWDSSFTKEMNKRREEELIHFLYKDRIEM